MNWYQQLKYSGKFQDIARNVGIGLVGLGLGNGNAPAIAQPQPVQQTTPNTQKGTQVKMLTTGYCRCAICCGTDTGITASGKDVSYNGGKFVAADRRYQFGTKMIVPGYSDEPVEVIDRGGAIKGNHIDLFFATHQEALNWGKRTVIITVLPPVPKPNKTHPSSYKVQSGDTLGGIAKAMYGSASKWTDIAKANPGIDPNKLQIGKELVIP